MNIYHATEYSHNPETDSRCSTQEGYHTDTTYYHGTDSAFVVLEEVYLNPKLHGAAVPPGLKQQRPH